VLSRDGRLTPELLPASIVHGVPVVAGIGAGRSLAAVEQEHIRAVLRQTSGRRRQAAEMLGISTATLWRKLKDMAE
jgi:DNA-binding NtrC family response regulator